METCVSKVCPFCQTDIQEGEAIKECPSCGAVYHERCWEQHKGCATVGCPEHPDVIPDVPVADVCPNCGAALGDDQNFCTQCGRLKVGEQQISCVNCGAELQMDQLFCPKCGAPTGNMAGVNTPPVVYPVNGAVVQKKSSAAKIVALIVALLVGISAAVVAGVLLIPRLLVSTDDLLAQGAYAQAYERAGSDEKEDVLTENQIAYLCKDVIEELKDPSSFKLRNAWYDQEGQYIVLKVSGKNSYGGVVSNYWCYTYDSDKDEYELFCTLSDLDEEKAYSWDDTGERLEKWRKKAARERVKDLMADESIKIQDKSIENINHLFKEDLLDGVELIFNS